MNNLKLRYLLGALMSLHTFASITPVHAETINAQAEKELMNKLEINGMYQHYSGKIYKVVDVFRHSESLELYVAYVGQYEDSVYGTKWVRPLAMFLEEVDIKGQLQPRFKKLK